MSNLNLLKPVASPQSQRMFMSRNVLHQLNEMNKKYINDLETSGRGDPYYNYIVNPMTSQQTGAGKHNTTFYPEVGLQFAITSGEQPGTYAANYVTKPKLGKGMSPTDDFKKDLKKDLKPKRKGKGMKVSKPEYKDEFVKPKRERIRKPKQPKASDLNTEVKDEVAGSGLKDKLKNLFKDAGKQVLKSVAPAVVEKGTDVLKNLGSKGIDMLKNKINEKIQGLGKRNKKNKKGSGSVGLVAASTQIPTDIAVKDKLVGSGKKTNKWLTFLKSKKLSPKTMPKKGTKDYDKLIKEYRK